MPNNPLPEMRLDKWLWHARFFKSRTHATQFVKAGKVRINGARTTRTAALIRIGDTLTFPRDNTPQAAHICVLEIVALPTRRASPRDATTLYDTK